MLKTLKNTESTIKAKKSEVGVASEGRDKYNSKAKYDGRNELSGRKIDSVEVRDNESIDVKNYQKTSKSQKTFKFKMIVRFSHFFTFEAGLAFIKLR